MPRGETRKIDPEQWEEILGFINFKTATADHRLTKGTIDNCKRYLYDLAAYVKPTLLSEVSKEKILEYLNQRREKDAEATHAMRKTTIKSFYAHAGQVDKVKDIKVKVPPTTIREEDLPTDEEMEKILAVVKKKKRDYALVSMLMELGCRVGEISKLKRSSIRDEGDYFSISIKEGKTGARRTLLPLVESAPALKEWLNEHPVRSPDAPLFTAHYKNEIKPLGVNGIWFIFNNACERAGVRHIPPKQWRHRVATIKARAGWSEQQLKEFIGWSPSSKMASVYVHNAGSYERALEDAGIKPKKVIRSKRGLRDCQYCGTQNDRLTEYCVVCGGNLNVIFSNEEIAEEMRAYKSCQGIFKQIKSAMDMKEKRFPSFEDVPGDIKHIQKGIDRDGIIVALLDMRMKDNIKRILKMKDQEVFVGSEYSKSKEELIKENNELETLLSRKRKLLEKVEAGLEEGKRLEEILSEEELEEIRKI